MNNRDPSLLLYFGHHKCGTNWTNLILHAVAEILRIDHATFNNWLLFDRAVRPQSLLFAKDFLENAVQSGVRLLAFTDSNIAVTTGIAEYRGFHVVRDPRDLAVSAYYSHRFSHSTKHLPGLAAHRRELERLSEDDGLLLTLEYIACLMDDLFTWNYDTPGILEVRFEELIGDPVSTFLRVFEHLGLLVGADGRSPLSHEQARAVIMQFSFERLTGGRAPGLTDRQHHYRKGVAGDWVNAFRSRHVEEFKSRYNDVLLKLGYEKSPSW